MQPLEIRRELEQLAEPGYQAFTASLSPGVEQILGVRMPHLRKLASAIVKDGWQEYLAFEPYYFEELMLQGIVVGGIKVAPEERLGYIADFVPRINGWSVCDTFCGGLKFTAKNQAMVWEFLQPYLQSGQEFQIRFAVVMMMTYYLDEAYIDTVLELLDGVKHDAYYVKMAVAWALATALAKQPDATWAYFEHHHLDTDTWKKTIQKCLESYRVPDGQKEALRAMRRQLTGK